MLLHESSSKCLKFWFSFCIIQVLIWAWSHRNVHGHRWTDLSCGKLVSSFYLGKNSDHQLWILVLATQSNKFCRLVLTFVGLFNRRLRRIKKPKKKTYIRDCREPPQLPILLPSSPPSSSSYTFGMGWILGTILLLLTTIQNLHT